MVTYVKYEHINKNKWDETIGSSLNPYIYAYSYYLDITTENQWDALIKDEYEMVMPLPFSKKFGIKYIHQPPFNQQLGIFYKNTCSNFDIFEFIRAVPKKFRLVEINFNKYLTGRIPEKYVAATNSNFELEVMDEYSQTYKGYSTNLKRNLKKAQKNNLKEINFVKPEELVKLFLENKGKEIKTYPREVYQRLIKLTYMLMHKGKAEVHGIINEMNTVIAAALFVRSHGRIIFLFSGLSEEGKEKGAMPFLIDYHIRNRQDSHYILDFEGSNNKNLARFYAGFGAKKFRYQRLEINRLNPLAKWGVRILKSIR